MNLSSAQIAQLQRAFQDQSDINLIPCAAMPWTGPGVQQIVLPKSGYLKRISGVMRVAVSLAAGAGTYTNAADIGGIPSPYNYLRSIQLYSNDGLYVRDYDGFGNYLEQRSEYAYDSRFSPAALSSTAGYGVVHGIPSVLTQGTTVHFNIPIVINVEMGEASMMSLLLLESDQSTFTLKVEFGTVADLVTPAGGGVATITSVDFTPHIQVYTAPADRAIVPYASLANLRTITQERTALTGGTYIYRPPLKGSLLSLKQMFVDGALGRLVPDNVNNDIGAVRMTYNTTQTPIRFASAREFLLDYSLRYKGSGLPDGVYGWYFKGGNGNIDLPSLLNAIPLVDAADIAFEWTLGGAYAPAANSFVRNYVENLQPVRLG